MRIKRDIQFRNIIELRSKSHVHSTFCIYITYLNIQHTTNNGCNPFGCIRFGLILPNKVDKFYVYHLETFTFCLIKTDITN